ncbi:hypothetical protein CW733_15540 [Lacinutrix sp. Bg11-31]|nr:hypothetical protein CW733_15540 [Lacinutrix sp. Bg11-31]
MAFVVLFSTLSFTIESHYCGTNLIDTAVFSKVKNCGMESSAATPIKKRCCKDEVVVVQGQDKLKLNSFDDLDINQQILFTSYVYSYISLFISLPKQVVPHKEYVPPNLIYDIQVLDETFLI